jgi:hypothetical protein
LRCPLSRLAAAVRDLEFVNDVPWQPTMFGHSKPLPLGPGTYLPAALPARCRSGPRSLPLRAHRARMFHKRSKLAPELAGMPGAQVYFVLVPVQAEPHGLVGRAASQVILQMHFDPLH